MSFALYNWAQVKQLLLADLDVYCCLFFLFVFFRELEETPLYQNAVCLSLQSMLGVIYYRDEKGCTSNSGDQEVEGSTPARSAACCGCSVRHF